MSKSIDRVFVQHVGGQVLSTQLSALRDPAAVDDSHLDKLADMSVRAALALDGAIPRAEERLAAEAKAADEAAAAARQEAAAVERAAAAADKVAAKAALPSSSPSKK